MATSMDQQTSDTTALRQIRVELIGRFLVDGMPVFDMYGEQVGYVKTYNTAAGYLQVGSRALVHRDLYIPFRLIRSIDPHEICVSEIRHILTSRYTEPPPISTVVEYRMASKSNGSMTPQVFEVQVVPSGFDDRPAEFNRVDLDNIMDRLAVGMVVYDATGERLGETSRYDAQRSLMVVEKGIFKPKMLLVPFSAIREIHPSMCTVYLSLPRAVLMKDQALLPEDA